MHFSARKSFTGWGSGSRVSDRVIEAILPIEERQTDRQGQTDRQSL